MFKSIAVRYSQGSQTIKDPRQASPKGFRGRPQIADADCVPGCSACLQACSVRAIKIDPLRIDLLALGASGFGPFAVEACAGLAQAGGVLGGQGFDAVLVCAHDAVNKAILCDLLGLPMSHFWQIKQDNACINVIECDHGIWRLVTLNATTHLGYLVSGIEQKGL